MPLRGGASLVRAMSGAADPLALLGRIVDQALVLVSGAEGSAVELVSEEQLLYVCTAGSLSSSVGLQMPAAGSLSGLAVATGQILRCDDTESDDRVDRLACRRLGARAMLCVPLIRPSGAMGVLKVISSEPAAFSDRDVHVLARLAEFISTAVAAASEFARLITELVHDDDLPPDGQFGIDRDDNEIANFIANVMRAGVAPRADLRARIEGVLEDGGFEMLYQPIFHLTDRTVVGAEALARFTQLPYRSPDVWFAEAEQAGLGVELELAAVRAALAPLPFLPPSIRLSVNVGPATIGTDELTEIVESAGPDRVTIELTEHLKVEDYPKLNSRLAGLREQQTLLAIDDTGAGISSLTHVLKLAPDVIKLDREITRGVDLDPVRRALTAALLSFARESGAEVVAEGIETQNELEVLEDLGVRYGQGFYLGRPAASVDLRKPHRAAAPSGL